MAYGDRIKSAIISIQEVIDDLTGNETNCEVINKLIETCNLLYLDLDKEGQKALIEYLDKEIENKRRQLKTAEMTEKWWKEYQEMGLK